MPTSKQSIIYRDIRSNERIYYKVKHLVKRMPLKSCSHIILKHINFYKHKSLYSVWIALMMQSCYTVFLKECSNVSDIVVLCPYYIVICQQQSTSELVLVCLVFILGFPGYHCMVCNIRFWQRNNCLPLPMT